MTEKEYRSLPADKYFNYSMLSAVSRKGGAALLEEREDSPSLKMGSLIHTLGLSRELFDSKYRVIKDFVNLSEQYMQLYQSIKVAMQKELMSEDDILDTTEYFQEFCLQTSKDLNLWKNITKDETRRNKIVDKEFLSFLRESLDDPSDNRICIGAEQFFIAELSHKALAEDEFTSCYFNNKKDIKQVQVLTEYPILFKIKNDHFKILLDIVYIDHEKKTIGMVDLKTSSKSHISFDLDFFIWRYDIQAALAIKALEELRRTTFKDYSILLPRYILVSKVNNEYQLPLIYKVPLRVCKLAFVGYSMKSGVHNKGIYDLVKDIKHYRKTKQYNLDRKFYEHRGELEINNRFTEQNSLIVSGSGSPFERLTLEDNEEDVPEATWRVRSTRRNRPDRIRQNIETSTQRIVDELRQQQIEDELRRLDNNNVFP